MFNTAVIDIETIPSSDFIIKKHIYESMKPPGNISNPDTIKRWMDNPENLNNAIKKTALSGLFGNIACIGIKTDDQDDVEILSGDERDILIQFLAIIREYRTDGNYKQKNLVGHNIIKFDAPIISQRMLVHGIGPLYPFNSKSWEWNISDTMNMFSAHAHDYIKLVDLCLALGVEKPLDEIDGSQVADAWLAGEYEKIYDHCRSDVMATDQCYKRLTNKR